ncbi:MAG: NfeD family protein [Lachnospiraceae bacterium]
MNVIFWLLLFIVLVVIEIVSLQLVSIWFSCGALASIIVALLGGGIEGQLVAFIIVSLFSLIMVKPIATKYFSGHVTKTNVDSLIGMTAKVIQEVNNQAGYGAALLNGQEWTAVAEDDNAVIKPGEYVVVKKISGVKLIVEKKEDVKC